MTRSALPACNSAVNRVSMISCDRDDTTRACLFLFVRADTCGGCARARFVSLCFTRALDFGVQFEKFLALQFWNFKGMQKNKSTRRTVQNPSSQIPRTWRTRQSAEDKFRTRALPKRSRTRAAPSGARKNRTAVQGSRQFEAATRRER